MIRPRQAGEFELLGALGQEKDLGKSFTAKLPEEKYIYECRKGLVGKSDKLVFNSPMRRSAALPCLTGSSSRPW